MEIVSLLFDSECRMLGELCTTGGALVRAVLTEDGDRLLGQAVARWQTEGVPFLKRMDHVQVQEHIPTRSAEFLEAVRQWSAVMHVQLISVTSDVLQCWQMIAHLPLEPLQRYSMVLALRALSLDELAEWKTSLQEAVDAVEVERKKTATDIQASWQKIAKRLMHPAKKPASR